MALTDEQAREMMFGNTEGEDLNNEILEEDASDPKEDNQELEDIDIENDEDLKELKKQSPKLDSAFAKLRREREQLAKEKEELDSKVSKYSGFVAEKYKNEYGIENLDQFFEYMKTQDQHETEETYNTIKNDLIENYGVDPNIVDSLIKNHPDYIKNEQMAKQILITQEQNRLNTEYESTFKELQAEYSKFESIEDINKILGEKSNKFWELFKDKGLSMLEAYELADRENLRNPKKSSEQNSINKQNSKSHLKPTKTNAEVDYTDINNDELQWYKGLMGNKMTEQQMIEHSKKNRR